MPVAILVGPGRLPRVLPKRWRGGSTVLPIPSAPGTPTSPTPADGGTALYALLSWSATGATKFDISLGTSSPPPLVVTHYVGTTYVPTLQPGTHYFWQIVAFNDGGSTAGPIWTFDTPAASAILFLLDGVLMTSRVRFPGGLSIRDVLGATPNTGSVLFDTAPPNAGQAITIGLGSLDPDHLLFGGEIQFLDESYESKPDLEIWPANLIDHTFSINARRPFGTFLDQSATFIAHYCLTTFAPDFTGDHVQADLPVLSINFDGQDDFMSCMSRLATGINGRTKVDYSRDLHLFITEDVDAPDPIDVSHPCLNDPPIRFSTELSQVRTRVYGKAHGENLLSDVLSGEWILPVADGVMYNPFGGQVIVGTTADSAQTLIANYFTVQLGGRGSLVGPGASPTGAPTVTQQTGAGSVDVGAHDYAVTFITASGESLPGPREEAALLPPGPTPFGFSANLNASDMLVGDSAAYLITFTGPSGESQAGTISNTVIVGGPNPSGVPNGVVVTWNSASVPARATGFRLYRFHNAVWDRYFAGPIPGGNWGTGSGGFFDNGANWTAAGVFTPPLAAKNQMQLTVIPTGQASVTSRKVYRSPAGSTQLKLLTTFADNTTLVYTDTTADASLGANAPTIDASGLTQPAGQVLAGETSLLTAGTSPFDPSGGWAIIGNGQQVIRYTGVTGGSLTGIPASGPGAIVASVSYNSTVTAAPAIVGINAYNGVPVALAKGSKVNLWVQRDDLPAQTALGLLERKPDGTPGDGIRESTLKDERVTEASMIDLCDAELARFSRPIVGVSYHCRDPKTRAGKTVAIDLTTPGASGFFDPDFFDPTFFDAGSDPVAFGLSGDFLIQDVTITFDAAPSLLPRYAVKASSAKFTFEDLLQRVLVTQ